MSWLRALMPSYADQCTLDEQQGQQVCMTFLLLMFIVIKCCNKGYHVTYNNKIIIIIIRKQT